MLKGQGDHRWRGDDADILGLGKSARITWFEVSGHRVERNGETDRAALRAVGITEQYVQATDAIVAFFAVASGVAIKTALRPRALVKPTSGLSPFGRA